MIKPERIADLVLLSAWGKWIPWPTWQPDKPCFAFRLISVQLDQIGFLGDPCQRRAKPRAVRSIDTAKFSGDREVAFGSRRPEMQMDSRLVLRI